MFQTNQDYIELEQKVMHTVGNLKELAAHFGYEFNDSITNLTGLLELERKATARKQAEAWRDENEDYINEANSFGFSVRTFNPVTKTWTEYAASQGAS